MTSQENLTVFADGKYDALYISKCILKVAGEKDIKISNLKLHKLLYIVQGMFFAYTEQVLFKDDFVAWNYGPAIPEVYYKYRHNCSEPIVVSSEYLDIGIIDDKILSIITIVLNIFGNKSDWGLIEFTRKLGPWKRYYNSKQENIIPKEEIVEFFGKIIKLEKTPI